MANGYLSNRVYCVFMNSFAFMSCFYEPKLVPLVNRTRAELDFEIWTWEHRNLANSNCLYDKRWLSS